MNNKIVVAPQIVIYKEILNNCKDFIDIVDSSSREESLWGEWNDWYDQGKYMSQEFKISELDIKLDDKENIKKEKSFLQDLFKIYHFIKDDYLNEYSDEKGNWPSYITRWDKIKKSGDYKVGLDIYKYNMSYKDKADIPNELMLQYHVDEMPEGAHEKYDHKAITITIYPNDDYDGGEICFYDEVSNKAYKYKPKAGDITVFPSAAPFYHGVMPFAGADRYFLRIFISYSLEGDEDWIKNNKSDSNSFIKEQQDKIDKFVSKYGNMITLSFPGDNPKNIFGKVVQLDEDIIIVEG
jgi:hypothetical protein